MNFVLAAGGTGGHMVPAHALAVELKRRGHQVALITDQRGARFPGLFGNVDTHILPAGRLGGGVLGLMKAARGVLAGRREARMLYRQHPPDAVVGFGGYPALPALLAASSAGIPTIIHEQNAVMGRVNRLFAREADAIATAHAEIDRMADRHAAKVQLVGNPVREEIAALGTAPFPAFDAASPLRLLVTGGSQGATILSKVVPDGLALLEPALRERLEIVQQCRPDDVEVVRARYAELGLTAELCTYIEDMAGKLRQAHLFVGRAGASTVAELTAAGRPAVLIPYAAATDDHQTANAREMARAGGAKVIPQAEFTPEALKTAIEELALTPGALAAAAGRALSVGRPRAASDLADLVERVARSHAPRLVGPASTRAAPASFGVQGATA